METWLETVDQVDLVALATAFSPASIASTIIAQISAYSIAVAPSMLRSRLVNLRNRDIHRPAFGRTGCVAVNR